MKRVVLALVAAGLTLLAAESVLRIGFDRSLLGASVPTADPDAPGLYRPYPHTHVGYVLRADAELAIYEGEIRSDAMGLRRRAGPPMRGDPLRIVLLGDSVVFGFGLDDDETIAHQLELELADARAPGTRPVLCRTVAVPGWNHRNATRFLLDNLQELDPHLVLYMPIANDLYDTDGVARNGKRRAKLDAASPEPWLAVDQLAGTRFAEDARERLHGEGRDDVGAWMGPPALLADLSPGSSDRYEQNIDSIVQLSDALDARGARLALLKFKDEAYVWNLRRRLIERARPLPVIPLFERVPPDLTLGFDPHPNADGARLMAQWIAGELLARRWVPGGDADTARALMSTRGELRAKALEPDEVLTIADVARTGQWLRLHDTIDWMTLEGVAQILGGVNLDGSVGTRALLLLAHGGTELIVEFEPIDGRDDLVPLDVAVEIDGQHVGTVTLDDAGPVSGRFGVLPPKGAHAEPLEVRLIPDRWADLPLPGGKRSISFRPLRVSCPPD